MGTQASNPFAAHKSSEPGEYRDWRDKRHHDDPLPKSLRTESERDADRILYSSAFQRLAGVTQVTSPDLGAATHSRLTHSMKVAQLARRTAERIKRGDDLSGAAGRAQDRLDPEAAYAAGLAHDLGHPPFGHIAETELKRLTESAGGFEGNAQTFRVVTRLAARSGAIEGLNLSRAVLCASTKYPWACEPDAKPPSVKSEKWGYYGSDAKDYSWSREGLTGEAPVLEALLMDWADDVTYAVHDIDDFFRVGLVPLHHLAILSLKDLKGQPELAALASEDLEAALEVLQGLVPLSGLRHPYRGARAQRAALRSWGSFLIDRFVSAVSLENDAASGEARLVIDQSALDEVSALKTLTKAYVIGSPRLGAVQAGQREIVHELFKRLLAAVDGTGDRRLIPARWESEIDEASTPKLQVRLVADIIASLSELGAYRLHEAITGRSRSSLMPAPG